MMERSPGNPGPQEISSQVEVHSIDHIPESERHGTLRSLGSVWFVSNLNLTAMATGVVIVSSYTMQPKKTSSVAEVPDAVLNAIQAFISEEAR